MDQQRQMTGGSRGRRAGRAEKFVPLAQEGRTHVDTACAAYHFGRRPQTMRVWASAERGPLRPVRVNGRLVWSVAEIRGLLQGPIWARAL